MLTTTPDVVADLRADGFRQGPPPHLHADMLLSDMDTYSALECAVCGHGHHKVTPWHRGREYRLRCVCRACGNAVEM
jgi:hypothetical protein